MFLNPQNFVKLFDTERFGQILAMCDIYNDQYRIKITFIPKDQGPTSTVLTFKQAQTESDEEYEAKAIDAWNNVNEGLVVALTEGMIREFASLFGNAEE